MIRVRLSSNSRDKLLLHEPVWRERTDKGRWRYYVFIAEYQSLSEARLFVSQWRDRGLHGVTISLQE